MGGACRCEEGWTGAGCDQRVCNPLCIKHGTCKDGKCQCHQGWNGEHCTIGKRLCVFCVCGGVCLMCVCQHVGVHRNTSTQSAAPLHFVKGIWSWEVEAKGRPLGIWIGRADVGGGRAVRRGANFSESGGERITKEHDLTVFRLPLNCRPQES